MILNELDDDLQKNNTDNGEMVVRTGVTNSKEFGRIMSWNGQTQLDHWNGTCNLINGTGKYFV